MDVVPHSTPSQRHLHTCPSNAQSEAVVVSVTREGSSLSEHTFSYSMPIGVAGDAQNWRSVDGRLHRLKVLMSAAMKAP